jgi:hypothetical protein
LRLARDKRSEAGARRTIRGARSKRLEARARQTTRRASISDRIAGVLFVSLLLSSLCLPPVLFAFSPSHLDLCLAFVLRVTDPPALEPRSQIHLIILILVLARTLCSPSITNSPSSLCRIRAMPPLLPKRSPSGLASYFLVLASVLPQSSLSCPRLVLPVLCLV